MAESFQAPNGLLAMTSPGSVRVETMMALTGAALLCHDRKLPVHIQHFGGSLVDKARNDAARACLGGNFGYVLFIDGDMTFPQETIFNLVQAAYTPRAEWADAIGAYCVLRGGAIPTIDTGTGTWESHFPGSGVLEVIRTGAAFLLVKRHCFEKMKEPWFLSRQPMRWLDAMTEIDNLSRTHLHGINPFRDLPGKPWETLLEMASNDPQSQKGETGYMVGEDSGFCDAAKAMGLRLAVDTDLEIGHIDTTVLNGASHKAKMDERERDHRLLYGVLR